MFWAVLVFFLLAYIAMQAFIYVRLRGAYPLPGWARALVGAFLCVMIFVPLWSRLLDRAGHETASAALGVIGFTWMIIAFWFCAVSALVILWNGIARLAGRVRPGVRRTLVPVKASVKLALVFIAVGLVWGSIEASRLTVEEIWIQTPRLRPGTREIRLVQISDLHIGRPRGIRFVRRLVRKLEEVRPDILVSTGDMTDVDGLSRPELVEAFRSLQPPLGKYAVTGNHEYFLGLKDAEHFHRAAGFQLLHGEAVAVAPGFVVAGVDDVVGRHWGQPAEVDEAKALAPADPSDFVVLLKHQPLVNPKAVDHFDLQLSGHVHGGQVFPFGWFVRLMYPYLSGMHRVSDRSLIYVSRGTGVWGTPLRVLAPAEITVFVISPPQA